MKYKTSVTLSEEVIRALDDLKGEHSNRSQAIEKAVHFYIEQRRRQKREARDLKILNSKYKSLNKEAEDVLDYQIDL